MSLMMKPSHALFFNGVTDGAIVPRMNFRDNFGELHEGSDLNNQSTLPPLSSFTIEAWVIPDSGGIVWEQETFADLWSVAQVQRPFILLIAQYQQRGC